jgi:transketolase
MNKHPNMSNYLEAKAKAFRKEIFKFKTRTGNGHLASCLCTVDVLVSLFYDEETLFDPKKDKVIFSKAHGSPAIYPILADLEVIPKDELDKYCRPEGILRLHSDQSIPGCYFVGGSLGNGIGYAAGRAKANPDSNIYVIVGDAELYEGSVWETLLFIAHHKLKNIRVIIDRNYMGILGKTEELVALEPLKDKLMAFGFDTEEIDGHNYDQLRNAFNYEPVHRPLAVIARTIKGKGVSYMEGKYEYHTIIPKSKEDVEQGLKELS